MRIAQVVPLQVAVPPQGYGGTERVVDNLIGALVGMGHDVTLFATGDSQTSARLVPMLDRPQRFDPEHDATAYHVAMLEEIYTRHAADFDVIHSHLDYLTLPFLRLSRTPTVLTLHGRLDKPEWDRVFHQYPDANYVSISDAQRAPLPDLNWVATVHHGLDVENFPFRREKGDYLAFVGRMSPQKRPDVAIEVAKRCGLKLKIAAKVDNNERPYFKREIVPLLDHPLVDWLGEVGEHEKRMLMANALALLVPINWPEPFGMVFIEALACGTPVVTSPIGSVPELLKPGLTGYHGRTVEELVEAVRKVRHLPRRACRAYAERRFSTARMAREYVQVYDRLQRREQAPASAASVMQVRSPDVAAPNALSLDTRPGAVVGGAAVVPPQRGADAEDYPPLP